MSRILYIHPKNDFTGSTRVLATELDDLYSDEIFDVITAYNNGDGFLTGSNIRFYNIPFLRYKNSEIPVITSFVYRISFIIKLLLIGYRYDVFYINTLLPFYASWIARIYNKKIVWHIHEKFINPSKGERLAEFVFNRTKAHRIFVSNYTKQQYPENQYSSSEIKYNRLTQKFIDNVEFTPIKDRARNQVIMISSLTINKGIDTFIDVSKMLTDLSFTLILSANKETIDNFLSTYNLPSNIVVLPAVSNIQPYLKQADLLLSLTNPKYSIETFGMTILEAMPYGIPAIVPNIGGPTEIIEHGFNGYCINTSKPEIVKEYILLALMHDNYTYLASNAQKRFYEKFQ